MLPLNCICFLLFSTGWSVLLTSWECVFEHLRLYKHTHRPIHAWVPAFFYMSSTLGRIAEMKAAQWSEQIVLSPASQHKTQDTCEDRRQKQIIWMLTVTQSEASWSPAVLAYRHPTTLQRAFFPLQLGHVLKLLDMAHSCLPPLPAQLGLQRHLTALPLD